MGPRGELIGWHVNPTIMGSDNAGSTVFWREVSCCESFVWMELGLVFSSLVLPVRVDGIPIGLLA
jgi:hypothetical protein